MTRTNVDTVLDNLVTSMTPYFVGDGKPLVEMTSYIKTNFQGKSPVGVITRNNNRIRQLTAQGSRLIMRVNLNIFVLRVDPANTSYTEQDAEYALSASTDAFISWLDANRRQPALGWQKISLEQDTFLRPVVDDAGNSYWMETYMMEVENW